MAGITLEQLARVRGADKLTNWSTETDSTYGRQSKGLKHHGFAGDLNKVIELNNAYLQSGNIGKDIQYYYDKYGNNANIDDFITHYNSNISTLNKNWEGDPLEYNDQSWQGHNQLYRKMYHYRSDPNGDESNGNIGYDDSQDHILGSNTWLRNTDNYDKTWADLTDEEKTARTHTITIGGKQYKVGKDQFGHLVKIDDPAPAPEPDPEPEPDLVPDPEERRYNEYDITTPEKPYKPKFQWHDWLPLGMQLGNNLIGAATTFNNNALQKTPLLQGYRKVHKDTSNYFQRSILEDNKNKMWNQVSSTASKISDPTQRNAMLQQAADSSLQNAIAQGEEFGKAREWNITNATNVSNFNNAQETEIANANHKSNVAAFNTLIANRNEFANKKQTYLNDWIDKTNASYKEAVKGFRQNLQNVELETAKFNLNKDLYNLNAQYDADLFNANYSKDYIGDVLQGIYDGKLGGNDDAPTIYDTYYKDYLDATEHAQLEGTLARLNSGAELTAQDKVIIDKILAIDDEAGYNKTQLAKLNNHKQWLGQQYNLAKQNRQLQYSDLLKNQSVLLTDQGFNPWSYKKGGKVDTSIINNAFKNFQKEQESARKDTVENAKLRLSKLEKELDRIHEKQIFLLKQIYK